MWILAFVTVPAVRSFDSSNSQRSLSVDNAIYETNIYLEKQRSIRSTFGADSDDEDESEGSGLDPDISCNKNSDCDNYSASNFMK